VAFGDAFEKPSQIVVDALLVALLADFVPA
jgi:hypothetical protein